MTGITGQEGRELKSECKINEHKAHQQQLWKAFLDITVWMAMMMKERTFNAQVSGQIKALTGQIKTC